MDTMKASLLFLSVVLSACQAVVGSGTVTTTTREVSAFRQIAISSGITAHASTGPRALTIRADDNLQALVETRVENDTLIVRLKPTTLVANSPTLEAEISNDFFEGVEASGGVHVTMTATPVARFPLSSSGGSIIDVTGLSSTEFTLEASGGSVVTLTGVATRGTANASGASHLKLSGVPLESLEVSASGGSTITARVSGTLTGSASGGSSVSITGTPASTVESSGGSQVHLGAP
jgi:hypothetical protein